MALPSAHFLNTSDQSRRSNESTRCSGVSCSVGWQLWPLRPMRLLGKWRWAAFSRFAPPLLAVRVVRGRSISRLQASTHKHVMHTPTPPARHVRTPRAHSTTRSLRFLSRAYVSCEYGVEGEGGLEALSSSECASACVRVSLCMYGGLTRGTREIAVSGKSSAECARHGTLAPC